MESPERKKMADDRDELAARLWLATVKEDVLAEIGRRKGIAALRSALKDTATNRITTKSTEIAEALVTNALRAQFAKEITRIGVAELAIELKQEKSTYGVPRFKVRLIRKPDARVGDVLSEGEHRCVALAAFLAELATLDGDSAIVFDDPVSSLDHMHREAVADRLADEGQNRQVIIFTHDIAFLFLLSEACRDRDKPTHFAIRSISRGQDHTGFCNTNPPLKAQPVRNVIDAIEARLANEKVHYVRGNQEEWERTVRSLQEQLRTTWERAVEEALAPVFKGLSHKVNTPGLAKVTVITLDDCKVMREAFGRCSALLHSDAEGLNKPLPDPIAIQAEIGAMRNWVIEIETRQKAIP
jgi:wobble nucleotide-excising tRNase